MTKESVIKKAKSLGLEVEVSATIPGEFIYISNKDPAHYVRLLNYNGKWYGCHDGKVGVKDVSDKWILEAINSLK